MSCFIGLSLLFGFFIAYLLEKKYLIFGGQCFYASGGGYDLRGRTASKSSAIKAAESLIDRTVLPERDEFDNELEIEWAHIVHIRTGKIVATFGKKPFGR